MAVGSTSAARQVLGLLDRHVLQSRSTAILLAVYLGVLFKVWEHLAAVPPLPSPPHAAATAAAGRPDPMDVEPITRGSVLARGGRGGGRTTPKGGPVMRRSAASEPKAGEREGEAAEDPVALLESLLAAPGALAGEWPSRVQLAVGRLREGRGEQPEALAALEAAVRAAEAGEGGAEVAALGRVALGQLELRRHNYTVAGARFEEALAGGGARGGGPVLPAALVGAGWASLMDGASGRSESRLREALNSTGTPLGERPGQDLLWPAPSLCLARFDGLDGYRVVALSGLSLGRSLSDAAGEVYRILGEHGEADGLRACAARLLLEARAAAEGPGEEPRARVALGAAHLALGQVDAARRQFRRGLREERAGGDAALYLGLAAFAEGNATLGRRHLERLPREGGAAAAGADAAGSLARFAWAHAALPGGLAFAEAAAALAAEA